MLPSTPSRTFRLIPRQHGHGDVPPVRGLVWLAHVQAEHVQPQPVVQLDPVRIVVTVSEPEREGPHALASHRHARAETDLAVQAAQRLAQQLLIADVHVDGLMEYRTAPAVADRHPADLPRRAAG